MEIGDNPEEPSIMKSAVVHGIEHMKNGKAPDLDYMYSEIFKLLNEESLDVVLNFFNKT